MSKNEKSQEITFLKTSVYSKKKNPKKRFFLVLQIEETSL